MDGILRVHVKETASTNDLAKAYAREHGDARAVFSADRQSAGRGRMGRSFVSDEGGLYVSFLCRPRMPMANRAAQFSPFAALTGFGEAIDETARLTDRRIELSEAEKKAASIRYRIIGKGVPFSQARVPVGERVTWPSGYDLIWALLAPERTVLDAIRLRDGAFNAVTDDARIETHLAYFAFLEKYGYLERV